MSILPPIESKPVDMDAGVQPLDGVLETLAFRTTTWWPWPAPGC